MKALFFLYMTFALSLSAKILVSPVDAMKASYTQNTSIKKKNIILNKASASNIEQQAKQKLSSKIFRIYTALNGENILGYGILVNKKVRSKNAVVLYIISKDSMLKSIEIIAFNEPMEYVPSKTWNSQFSNVPTSTMLRVSREIPTITGATLSARSITNGSRLAFAFYNEMLKDK